MRERAEEQKLKGEGCQAPSRIAGASSAGRVGQPAPSPDTLLRLHLRGQVFLEDFESDTITLSLLLRTSRRHRLTQSSIAFSLSSSLCLSHGYCGTPTSSVPLATTATMSASKPQLSKEEAEERATYEQLEELECQLEDVDTEISKSRARPARYAAARDRKSVV